MAVTRVWILLLFLLALFVGSLFLQAYLSKKESRWLGLVLPILSFLLSLIPILNLAAPQNGEWTWFLLQVGLLLLLENIPTIIYLIIYFVCREKRRQDRQIEKMNIQDLD